MSWLCSLEEDIWTYVDIQLQVLTLAGWETLWPKGFPISGWESQTGKAGLEALGLAVIGR